MNKYISIILPIRNEEDYIEDCLKSILSFDYNKELLEIIFVDGMSDDKTVEILKSYMTQNSNIRLLKNKDKIIPISMNIGIKAAKGEYICRLDAHAEYPSNYISTLLTWSESLDADNVGAVCITGIKNKSYVSQAIQFVMSDKFGVGDSLFRIGVKNPLEVDTVPFGFYKKEVFNKIGLYDERLIRTQDLELNKRLKKNGGKIYLIPSVSCTYFPREDLKSFFNNRFQTGKWVVLLPYLTSSLKSISKRHLIPLVFIISLMFMLVSTFIHSSFIFIFIFIIVLYSSILFFRPLAITKSFSLSIFILLAYYILHFSYGFGSLKGIYDVLLRRVK